MKTYATTWLSDLAAAASAAGWELVENGNRYSFAARGVIASGNLWIEATDNGSNRTVRVINSARRGRSGRSVPLKDAFQIIETHDGEESFTNPAALGIPPLATEEAPAAPAAPGKTHTVSEYRKDGVLQDTEYAFSDGDKWKVYEAGTITRTRSVKRQEHEGAEYRRAPLATLEGKLKHSTQVGETELLALDRNAVDEVVLEVINHDAPGVILEPETERISFDVTILEVTPDRVTARITASGMRPDTATARRLIVGTLANRLRDAAISGADITAERNRYFPTATLVEDVEDPAVMVAGSCDRIYTVDTIDGKYSGIIKHEDGTQEVKITERHLPAPAPATPPNPDLPVTPAGKTIDDVPFFDRSIKVVFKCPIHPDEVFASKDPYVSSWFPGAPGVHGCPKDCNSKTGEHILVSDYRPTRRG